MDKIPILRDDYDLTQESYKQLKETYDACKKIAEQCKNEISTATGEAYNALDRVEAEMKTRPEYKREQYLKSIEDFFN